MAVLSEEQTMLRDMAREWAKNESPLSEFRKVRDSGSAVAYDPAAYRQMAQMGWAGVVIPEAHGGSDFGWLSLGLVVEEAARTLTASPLVPSAVVASALVLAGSDAQKSEWLPKLASGETVATLAVDEGPRHDPEKVEAKAERSGDGWTLTGTKTFVPEGDGAGLFLVAADAGEGTGLFLVPADADGVSRSHRSMTDARSHAEVRFESVKLGDGALVGGADGKLLEQVLDRARILAAAEMLGLSGAAFEATNAYLKQRVQFNQVLSTFQALQHRMANLFTRIELMRSAVEGALEALDSGGDVREAASLAKAMASETAHLVTNEAIQLHGGVGMTDEFDIGFYLKRSRILEQQWGNAAFHRERWARLNGY